VRHEPSSPPVLLACNVLLQHPIDFGLVAPTAFDVFFEPGQNVSVEADRDGLFEGEEVVVPFVIAGCDRVEVLEAIEEALHEVTIAVGESAEGRASLTTPLGRMLAQAPRAAISSRNASES